MSPGRRAFLGALLGALIVLLAHPVTRPYLATGLSSFGRHPAIDSAELGLAYDALPTTIATEVDASIWIHAGAIGLQERRQAPKSDIEKLLSVCLQASKVDKGNAFWLHMASTFALALDRPIEATEYWRQASIGLRWNDYQSKRLSEIAEAVSGSGGPSWRWAALFPSRSVAAAELIESTSKALVRSSFGSSNELRMRYSVLASGRLIRNGSRSLQVSAIGERMIEYASIPETLISGNTPRRLLLARLEFLSKLRGDKLLDESQQAENAFLENEAWMAMTSREDAIETFKTLAAFSLACSTLGGFLLLTALLGSLILLLGKHLNNEGLGRLLASPLPHVAGVAAGLLIYFLTKLPLAAISVALAFAFLGFGPASQRSRPPKDFGPFFGFVALLLSALIFFVFTAFLLGLSCPGLHVGPIVGVPKEYFGGSPLLLGLFLIALSLIFLVCPSWGIAQRVPTELVLKRILERIGMNLAVFGFTAAVICTPIAAYCDIRVGASLEQLVANEPIYFITG